MTAVDTASAIDRAGVSAERLTPPDVVLRRLAACMSRHVNNALTGVIGYLGLALREATGKGNLTAHLQAGLSCANHTADAVRRLVAFASPAAPPITAPLSLRELAEEAAQQTRSGRSGLRVEVIGDEGRIHGNAALVRSALEQLVRNAIEATPREGELTLRIEDTPEERRIQVIDRGPGLSPEAAAHLFDPFWTSKSNGHLGVGLILCRDIAHTHSGNLTINSTAAGTTATLSFPAPEEHPTTILAPSNGTVVPAQG